jgi:type IV pilus assembly protein PilC
MPTFKCKIAEPGQSKVLEQTLVADSKTSLKHHLEDQGNFVFEIRPTERSGSLLDRLKFHKKINLKEFYSFNQELSVLLKTGLTVVGALDVIVQKGRESEFKRLLKDIRRDVFSGESLSGAFSKYSHIFSKLYVATLQAGEKSGDLDRAIGRYLEYMKKTSEIRHKVISASAYPLILTMVSVITLMFLLMFVVPTFTGTFLASGAQLPGMTLFLIRFSTFLKTHYLFLFLGFILIFCEGIYLHKTEFGRMHIDRLKLSLPFIGDLMRSYAVSKFTRTLATVLKGGAPLMDAVRTAGGVLNNRFIKSGLEKVLGDIQQGTGFSESLEKQGLFPVLAVRMIHAGEGGGALEPVLNEIADFYEAEVEAKLNLITTAVEPALMVCMGFIIGFIVLAMYMPIFQLAGTIS